MVSRKETFDPFEQSILGFSQEIIKKHPILERYIRVVNRQPATPETKRKLVLYAVFCRLGQDQEGVLIEYSSHILSIENIADLLGVPRKDVTDSRDFMNTDEDLDLWKKYENALSNETKQRKRGMANKTRASRLHPEGGLH